MSRLRPRLRTRAVGTSGVTISPIASLSGLAAWYTASPNYCFTDAAGTVKCGDGDAIRVWKDRSGANRHLVQAASGLRPTLRSTAGGRWVVRFDGVDDSMNITAPIAADFTAFLVAQRDPLSTSGDRTVLSHANGGTDATLHIRARPVTSLRFGLFFDDLDTTITAITTRTLLAFTLTVALAQTTRQDLAQKGTRTAGGAYAGGNAALYVGSYFGTENWIGDVCEVAIATSQTSGTIGVIESHLRSSWATP